MKLRLVCYNRGWITGWIVEFKEKKFFGLLSEWKPITTMPDSNEPKYYLKKEDAVNYALLKISESLIKNYEFEI